MFFLSLLEETLELSPESLVIGLSHGAFPHAGGSFDEVSQSDLRLCLPIEGLNILGVTFFGMAAVEEGRLELFEGQVAGCQITMNNLLNIGGVTFYWSCCNAFRY